MSKRVIIFLAAILLAVLMVVYWFVFKPQLTSSEISINNAVPQRSSVIVKLNNPLATFQKLSENPMWKSATELDFLTELNHTLNTIQSLAAETPAIRNTLSNNTLIISIVANNENTSSLFLLPIAEKAKFDDLESAIKQYCEKNNIQIEKTKSNKAVISELIFAQNNSERFFFSFYKGILLFSRSTDAMDESIEQLNSKYSCDPQFLSLLKTAGQQVDLNVFVNHSSIDQLFNPIVSNAMKTKTVLLKNYAQWTEFDIQISEKNLVFGGFTSFNTIDNYFSQILSNQQPVTPSFDKILPVSTQHYYGFCVSDGQRYFSDYRSYLQNRNLLEQRNKWIATNEETTSINLETLFEEIFDNEIASASIPVETNENGNGNLFAVKTKSGSLTSEKMEMLQSAFLRSTNTSDANWKTTFQIDKQSSFTICKFPFPDLPKILWGENYNHIQANWFTVYDNYLIFGDTEQTVSKLLHSCLLGQTLSNQIEYRKFKANLSPKSNIQYYCNITESKDVAEKLFNNKIARSIIKSSEVSKFKAVAWQVSSSGNMLYNEAFLDYDPEVKSKSKTVWQSRLASNVVGKPQFVHNPSDSENKDILVQDNLNILYLINNSGRILWQLQLESKIMGEIKTIDIFKNRKAQFLFNTEEKIYLIDRERENVSNFPITLRSKATNGVSVFDYDSNKNYRFFVACADRNIYAYDESGKPLDGWDIFKTDHQVTQPVQHLRVEGKDFIVATDEMKDYFLHRRGNARIETSTVFPHSLRNTIYLEERSKNNEPRFVSTDKQGNLHYTYLDGKHDVKEMKPMSEDHIFIAANIDSDNETEYLFADSTTLSIYSDNETLLKEIRFETPISTKPEIFEIAKSPFKIGINIPFSDQIFLFNEKGELYKGFPLEGSTPFAITKNERSGYNIAVGDPNSFLNFYHIE